MRLKEIDICGERFNRLYKTEGREQGQKSLVQIRRMTTCCGGSLAKWFTLALLACQALSAPQALASEGEMKEIFSESKRDVSAAGLATIPLLKSPLFNPYLMYPPIIPGKPIFYPPFLPLTPSDILLNRFGKSVAPTSAVSAAPSKSAFNSSDPSLMSAYFKAKKDEFLTKLFERLTNTSAAPGVAKRAAAPDDAVEPTKPVLDSSFFLKKKFEFLDTLFKTLNVTPTPAANASDADQTANATSSAPTPKPTIVSPDFWFPFAKLPKPTKAPKPTKPPKAKKILKDALDTILLQSLLIDMGVDPKDASLKKRASAVAPFSKKSKSKKVKPEDELPDFAVPPRMDPAFTAKASDCLDKLLKILNKTDAEDEDSYVKPKPKPKVAPANPWAEPSDVDYTSKLAFFLDQLIKSLNSTEALPEKFEKPSKSSKSKPGKKILKRSTFLDELLHRVTPAPPTTTTPEPTIPPEDIIVPEDPECEIVHFLKECLGCVGKCLEEMKTDKSARSLIFKPFGSGNWILQYLNAAKIGMYLDKLMDNINAEAANEVASEGTDMVKRSADASDDLSGLPSKEAAINLIIAELTELKNDIVDAFAEGIKAQKDATPTPKPYGPASGKSFKKPFWASKVLPTTDPVAPIQKRIDILTDIFDKLTKVEKTLIFTSEPEYDPKLLANLTEILELNTKPSKVHPKILPKTPTPDPNSPEYFLAKTREYLKNLYGKGEESDE